MPGEPYLKGLGVKYIKRSRSRNKVEDMKSFLEQEAAAGVDMVLDNLSQRRPVHARCQQD